MTKPLPAAPRRSRCSRGFVHGLLASASLAALPLSLTTAARVAAQEPDCDEDQPYIVGFVIDAGTESPLASVLVWVESSPQASLTTDNGRFLLCDVRSGSHLVQAARLGYDTLAVQVEVDPSVEPVRLRMEPDPIVLEGLEIVTDRFERRRRAVAVPVRAFDQEELARSNYWSAAEFVDMQAGAITVRCTTGRSVTDTCVYDRGRIVRPRIFLDEAPLLGGWDELASLPTSHLYMIEVYRRGAHIRAYTHHFMARAAKTRLAPFPLWF